MCGSTTTIVTREQRRNHRFSFHKCCQLWLLTSRRLHVIPEQQHGLPLSNITSILVTRDRCHMMLTQHWSFTVQVFRLSVIRPAFNDIPSSETFATDLTQKHVCKNWVQLKNKIALAAILKPLILKWFQRLPCGYSTVASLFWAQMKLTESCY